NAFLPSHKGFHFSPCRLIQIPEGAIVVDRGVEPGIPPFIRVVRVVSGGGIDDGSQAVVVGIARNRRFPIGHFVAVDQLLGGRGSCPVHSVVGRQTGIPPDRQLVAGVVNRFLIHRPLIV